VLFLTDLRPDALAAPRGVAEDAAEGRQSVQNVCVCDYVCNGWKADIRGLAAVTVDPNVDWKLGRACNHSKCRSAQDCSENHEHDWC
jgi:hypothetical protein